jgi:enoyl-CoA hydratase/carnithine racemase
MVPGSPESAASPDLDEGVTMSDRVSVEIDEQGIADVRLNRPDKMNACDTEMFAALSAAGNALAENRSLRAVVLSGEGRAFCAGLDVGGFTGMANDSKGQDPIESKLLARNSKSPANFAQHAAWVWNEVPVPVIAALHGAVFGAGFQIALAADIRFVAPDARLSIMEIKWGLIPDMTVSQTLRRLVRTDIARELTFSGRILSGTEAVEMGIATHLSDTPRDAARELAGRIAGRSPDAIRAGKRLLNETDRMGVEEGLRLEAQLQATLIGRPTRSKP